MNMWIKHPLLDKRYFTNATEVCTYIINFISGNPVAEAKMVHNAQQNNRRIDFIALKNHYEGVGIHAVDIVKADKTLQDLLYSGEKKPHMWWNEFEIQLTDAFNTYD